MAVLDPSAAGGARAAGGLAGGAFVGRARELRAIDRCLEGGAELVTIAGTAGIGKTRLAIEWARAAHGGGPREGAGVVLCDLADVADVYDACAALARALGVPLAAGGTADEAVVRLGRALGEAAPTVVVLDDMDRLAALAPRMLPVWRALAPRARFVVTSRERLRLPGEAVIDVEPLGVPAEDERSLARIAASEAVALFVARARAARFDFELVEADGPAVAAIVRRLDGLPLAIELCAARASVLAPEQMLARLARRFDLLVNGARGAAARRATLRGAIDASWDLLDPWERDALAQCSIFRGGFSIEAAEGVIDLGAGAPPVLDVLQSLHDKSLIRAFDAPGAPSARRYGLLETLREYAGERLDQRGGASTAAERHAAFFLAMGGAMDSPFWQPADVRALARERDNLVAACSRALARRPLSQEGAEAVLRGLLLLEPVLLVGAKGRLDPYVEMLDAALDAAPAPAETAIRARAIHARAFADLLRGRVVDSLLGWKRAADAARAAGSPVDEGFSLTTLALLLDQADQVDEARACFDRARAIAAGIDEPALRAVWMAAQGGALLWRGRPAEALGYVDQALQGFRIAGHARGQSIASALVALAQMSLDALDEAEAAAGRALALLEPLDDRRTEGYVLQILGCVEAARGRSGEARAKLAAARSIHRAAGDRLTEGVVSGYLAGLAFQEGDLEAARAAYGEALALVEGTGDRHYVAVFLAALGAVEAGLGRLDAASSRFEAAAARLADVRSLATRVTVDLYAAHADAARAREAAAAGDAAAADRHRRAAEARIALALAPAPDGALPPARSAYDVRVAIRHLEGALASPAPPVAPRAAAPPTLVVGPEARWFRLCDREPVHMSKGRAARLVLAALVRHRLDAPGRGLPLRSLFEAGWPGERIAPKAAANRVYVTVTKLRRIGLAGLLVSRDDGFLLDPETAVVEALDPAPPAGGKPAAEAWNKDR